MQLQPGDIFLSCTPNILGSAIKSIDRLFSLDDRAVFNHAGIILDHGYTFEVKTRVMRQSFLQAYAGKKVLIARFDGMSAFEYSRGYGRVLDHLGDFYPCLRLVLHLLRIAKYIHWHKVVCSELVVKFLFYATQDFRFHHWYGWTPDSLEDMVRNWKSFSIVYDGHLM